MITELLRGLVSSIISPMVSGFSWYNLIPGVGSGGLGEMLHLGNSHEAWVIPAAWLGCFVILGLAALARLGLNSALAAEGSQKYIPDASFSPRAVLEVFVEGYYSLVEGVIGKKEAPRFFPLIAALFLYIVTANIIGLIPGMLPVTENFSNNVAMAAVVFLVFNYAGLTRNGVEYVKHLAGPIIWLAWLIFPIEVLGLLIRPFSLSVRLTANMYADHLVSGAVRDVGVDLVGFIGGVLAPVPFYGLGFFVCVLQPFVFSLLTAVYIGLSTADMHHGHGDDHGHPSPKH
jgi:F-type H+-transporting ATPase subunit a